METGPFLTKMKIIYVCERARNFTEATTEFARFRNAEFEWTNCGPDQEDRVPCSFKHQGYDAIYYCWRPVEPSWMRADYSGKFVIAVPDLIFV